MERIYSDAFPITRDVLRLIDERINDFNFFIVSEPGRSVVIHATNDRKELFDFIDFKRDYTRIIGKNSDGSLFEISKRELAKEKFKSLKEEEQFAIIQEIIIDRMLEKI